MSDYCPDCGVHADANEHQAGCASHDGQFYNDASRAEHVAALARPVVAATPGGETFTPWVDTDTITPWVAHLTVEYHGDPTLPVDLARDLLGETVDAANAIGYVSNAHLRLDRDRPPVAHAYVLCARCDHFVEPNEVEGPDVALYIHLDNGEKEHDHDAEPSDQVASLPVWRRIRPDLFTADADGATGPNRPAPPEKLHVVIGSAVVATFDRPAEGADPVMVALCRDDPWKTAIVGLDVWSDTATPGWWDESENGRLDAEWMSGQQVPIDGTTSRLTD